MGKDRIIRNPARRMRVLAAVFLVSTALPAVLSSPLAPYGYQAPAYEPAYQSYSEPAYQSYTPPASYEPAYSPPPTYEPSYQSYSAPAYEPSYAPSYQPSYSAPAYEPSYQPAYSPPVYSAPAYSAPAYEPSYQPSYSAPAYSPPVYSAPAYEPSYQPAYSPPAPVYSAPAYTPSYTPKPQYYQEYDNYDAITYREANESIHCGVLPTTNDELYQASKDVAPFGKYPWIVQITEYYTNNFLCQGVIIQHGFVLTAKSCVYGTSTDKLRIRIDDWDVLTNYNEYEAYKNTQFRVCDSFPVSYDAASSSYSYGGQDSKLIILEIDLGHNINDKYPATRHICLPTYYQQYYAPPAYSAPAYSAPAYSAPAYSPTPSYQAAQPYSPAPYSAPAYQPSYTPPPPTYAPAPVYSECWVVGWYGSEATQLKNHPPAVELQENAAPQAGYGYNPPSSGYGYSAPSYTPSYSPVYEKPHYYQEYYQYYDQSKIERRAKVKEIKCPYSSSYGAPPASSSYGYGYSSYKDEDVCFVGVDGYDACIADKGAAVFCLVPEKYGYEAGYNNYDNTYQSSYSAGYNPAPYTASYGPYEQSYYKKDITAITSPPKPERQRAVLYAIVQKTATCSKQPAPSSYGYGYQQQQYQSKPITATKVTYQVVDAIEDNFWQNGMDDSCPAPKTYYPAPQYSYQASYTPSYSPPVYSAPAYEPSYQPAYSPPAPVYSAPAYSPPVYSAPAYEPSYAPAYPSYQPPAYEPSYSPPVYEPSYAPTYSPPAPVYSAPAYSPPAPVYSAPAYSPPVYSAPAYEPSYAPAYPSYQPPAYEPSYAPSYQPAPVYSAPAYSAPAYSAPAYSAPAYEPSYQSYNPAPSYEPAYSAPVYSPPPSYGYQG